MWILGREAGDTVYTHDVWSSSNGVTWIQATPEAPWSSRAGHGTVALNGQMWVFGGISNAGLLNDVWGSSDGVIWMQATDPAPWTPRAWLDSLAFNGQIWMIGGWDGAWRDDVWFGQFKNPLSASQSAMRCGQSRMLANFERLPRLNPWPPWA